MRARLAFMSFLALFSAAAAAICTVGCVPQFDRATEVATDGGPNELAADDCRLFVGCFHGHGIQVFDLKTLKELHKVRLASYGANKDTGETYYCPPGDMLVVGKRLFVKETFSEFIVVFDTESMEVLRRVRTGTQGNMGISPDGKTLYYADCLKNVLFLMDTVTYELRQAPFPAGLRGIGAVAVSPDGRTVYLGIQRSDPPGGAPAAQGAEGGPPAADRQRRGDAVISAYDLTNGRYLANIPLVDFDRLDKQGQPQPTDDGWPTGMAFSPDGSRLFVTMVGSDVAAYVIDTRAHKIETFFRFTAPDRSNAIADACSPLVHEGHLFVPLRNYRQLRIIDLESLRTVRTIDWPNSNSGGLTPMLRVGHELFYGDIDGRCVRIKDLRDGRWWRPVAQPGRTPP